MTDTTVDEKSASRPSSGRNGNRYARFVREVIAEMVKVIWPTRKELITYTIVVVVFVAIMITLVAGLDAAFARLILAVFG
jgi:preprotein translocase subunit SecE